MLSNLVANLLVALLGNCAIWIVLKSVSSVWKWPKHWSLVQCTWAWEWNGGQSEAIIAAVTVAASASATSKRWANNNLNFKFFLLPGALILPICLPTYLPMLIHFFMLFRITAWIRLAWLILINLITFILIIFLIYFIILILPKKIWKIK